LARLINKSSSEAGSMESPGSSRKLFLRASRAHKPIEIGLGAPSNWDSDEFRDVVGVKLAETRFDYGDQVCTCFDEQQGLSRGLDRAVPSVNRMYAINDIDAACELLGNQSSGDAASFVWRTCRGKGYYKVSAWILCHHLMLEPHFSLHEKCASSTAERRDWMFPAISTSSCFHRRKGRK
jgi:hypothetical protein